MLGLPIFDEIMNRKAGRGPLHFGGMGIQSCYYEYVHYLGLIQFIINYIEYILPHII